MTVIEELALISRMAASLAHLPDNLLSERLVRLAVYAPADLALIRTPYERDCLDLGACKAEMIRRALRVGRGFGEKREAA